MTDERLGREARELIEQALREEEPADPSELARIRKRVMAVSVGVGALGSVSKTFAVPGTGGAVGAISIVKAALLGAGAAVVAVGLASALKPHEPRQIVESAPFSAPKPVVQVDHVEPATKIEANALPAPRARQSPASAGRTRSASVTTAPGATPEREHEAAGASPAPPRDAATSGSNDSSLLEEIALLERVQAALRAGNGALALSLLDQNSSARGSGQLGSERLAAEVFAACEVGDRTRASSAARRFFRDYAATPASARVRASCAGEEGGR